MSTAENALDAENIWAEMLTLNKKLVQQLQEAHKHNCELSMEKRMWQLRERDLTQDQDTVFPHPVTFTRVIAAIFEDTGVADIADIVERAGLPAAIVKRHLDALFDAGLVYRTADGDGFELDYDYMSWCMEDDLDIADFQTIARFLSKRDLEHEEKVKKLATEHDLRGRLEQRATVLPLGLEVVSEVFRPDRGDEALLAILMGGSA